MDARLIDRIETGAGRIASALFSGAVGYAAYALLSGSMVEPQLGGYALAAAAAALLLCDWAVSRVSRGRSHFSLSVFDLREFSIFGSDELLLNQRINGELLLTDADRLINPGAIEELMLDDVLGEISSDARVVHLFDCRAMPTPGELRSRIDNHIGAGSAAPVDASQALSEALAELKRSLR